MKLLLALTLGGSVLALFLLVLRYIVLRRMPSTVYYYAWLLVLLRFALPLPGLFPTSIGTDVSEPASYRGAAVPEQTEQIPAPALPNTVSDGLPAVPHASRFPSQSSELPANAEGAVPHKAILFHTGMRISEFCGLTISDIDFEHHLINIDHQLQRSADMTLVIQETKTHAGTRKLPMTADVEQCFRAIIEDRPTPRIERMVDGRSGFLFLDKDCLPEVAMHWEHRFNHMVKRYNDIYRVQMPNITPHVCRHTYCSNQAKAGMNPKTLQYLMGHSDIGVTLNTYTHLGLEDAAEELRRMEEAEAARREQEKLAGKEQPTQKLFRAV